MAYDAYEHFIVIVAGDQPDELMEAYDKNKKTDKYVVYRKKDCDKLRKQYIKYYSELQKVDGLSPDVKDDTKAMLEYLKDSTEDEFFKFISGPYDIDEETGDAVSTKNPKGKWLTYNIGKVFSIPFLTKTGEERFQVKKGDVDWGRMHLNGQDTYRTAWELVMEGREPITEDEKTIYENMKNRTGYFMKFETKENYVTSCTAFWGFAFLSEETGWRDLDEEMDQFIWMSNFYDLFIKPLSDDTLLTIYECTR